MTLSDTQSLVLSRASQHPERLAAAPRGLPAAARDAVFRAMLKNGLLAECAAQREFADLAWRQDGDGVGVALRITYAGLRAIGVEPDEGAAPDAATVAATGPTTAPEARPASEDVLPTEAAQGAPAAPDEAAATEDLARQDRPSAALEPPPHSMALRAAAQAVLDAWKDNADHRSALADPMEGLRAALAEPARSTRDAGKPRTPREGTKREKVLAMLRRSEGATVGQVAEATGWAPHTMRGFFAGLRKRDGIAVAVLERVRQVGPGKEGAKGSYTVYRVGAAG